MISERAKKGGGGRTVNAACEGNHSAYTIRSAALNQNNTAQQVQALTLGSHTH